MPLIFVIPESNKLSKCMCYIVMSTFAHTQYKMNHKSTLLEREKFWFYFWMKAWSPLCCHGNVRVDMAWNFVMSVATSQRFSSIQKTYLEIFHFVSSYIVTNHLILIHIKFKSWINLATPFFIILKALSKKFIKKYCQTL